MSAADSLDAVLLPLDSAQVLLPAAALIEVLPYAPTLALENAPPWLVGTLLWGAAKAPLVSLDALFAGINPRTIVHRRIVLLQAPTAHPRLHYFGFLTVAPPESLRITRNDLAYDSRAGDLPLGALCQVQWAEGERSALIPDLDALERMLLKMLRH
jgi:chemosensory pili system protein ChpC